MTKETKLAISYLCDYTNPELVDKSDYKTRPVMESHCQQVAGKLELAKQEVKSVMDARNLHGIAAALHIVENDRSAVKMPLPDGVAQSTLNPGRIGYLLAAGAWFDLPNILVGLNRSKEAVQLRKFRSAGNFNFDRAAILAAMDGIR